jgi:large subunit ribosomal protein L23
MSANLSIIKRVILTERNADQSEAKEKNQRLVYFFEVDKKANKIERRKALEHAFNLKNKIHKINTLIRPGKRKRMGRGRAGMTPERKRAIVYLKVGEEIKDL